MDEAEEFRERFLDLVYLTDEIPGVVGYIVGYLGRKLSLAEMTDLVENINTSYIRDGERLLPRPPGTPLDPTST